MINAYVHLQFTVMRFMVENVSAGPNVHRARCFLVECPEAGARLLTILKDAIVRHLVEQIVAGAQVSGCCVCERKWV